MPRQHLLIKSKQLSIRRPAGRSRSGRHVWIPPFFLPHAGSCCSCTCGGAGTGVFDVGLLPLRPPQGRQGWAGLPRLLGMPLTCTP